MASKVPLLLGVAAVATVLFAAVKHGQRRNSPEFLFGLPNEWTDFGRRNRQFLERFGRLRVAMNDIFIRTVLKPDTTTLILFFTGRQCVDDFFEVLLLCGNAEGYGAQKILRAMFERVVLLKYLHAFPEKVDDYVDFYRVTMHRHIKAIERFYGEGSLDPVKVSQAEASYEQVKDRYRHGVSWSPTSLADMADEVGLGKFAPFAYYEPLLQTHPNIKGLFGRLEGGETGHISYSERLNRRKSDEVLCTAHALLLHVCDVQIEHFGLDPERYKPLTSDFVAIWDRPKTEPGAKGGLP